MKLLVLRSQPTGAVGGPFHVHMDTRYAHRVVGHLTDQEGFCDSCADECINCRSQYPLDHSSDIAGTIEFPAVLPAILDDPEEYLPDGVPKHDVLLSIAVHEEILIAFLQKFGSARAVIVPIENGKWVSPFAAGRIRDICAEKGMEVALPKPFCAFRPSHGVLLEFQDHFKIGRPRIRGRVENNRMVALRVEVSAPCGATYFAVRGLEGHQVTDSPVDAALAADSRLGCYPCTACRDVDPEFNDSITHEAVKIQREILWPGCFEEKALPVTSG